MFQNMKWLSFPSRCKYFSGIMVYKAMNELTPAYISNLIPLSQNKTYLLRSTHKKDIMHKRPKTNYLKHTFYYYTPV
jgi:hypothetical protein